MKHWHLITSNNTLMPRLLLIERKSLEKILLLQLKFLRFNNNFQGDIHGKGRVTILLLLDCCDSPVVRLCISQFHLRLTPTPPPPGATAGHLPALSVPGGGAFANFALPGDWAFANPRAFPKPLARTRIPRMNLRVD